MHEFLIILNQRRSEKTISRISNTWQCQTFLGEFSIDDSNGDTYIWVCSGNGVNSFFGSNSGDDVDFRYSPLFDKLIERHCECEIWYKMFWF
jgi:hypothetical protein